MNSTEGRATSNDWASRPVNLGLIEGMGRLSCEMTISCPSSVISMDGRNAEDVASIGIIVAIEPNTYFDRMILHGEGARVGALASMRAVKKILKNETRL